MVFSKCTLPSWANWCLCWYFCFQSSISPASSQWPQSLSVSVIWRLSSGKGAKILPRSDISSTSSMASLCADALLWPFPLPHPPPLLLLQKIKDWEDQHEYAASFVCSRKKISPGFTVKIYCFNSVCIVLNIAWSGNKHVFFLYVGVSLLGRLYLTSCLGDTLHARVQHKFRRTPYSQ